MDERIRNDVSHCRCSMLQSSMFGHVKKKLNMIFYNNIFFLQAKHMSRSTRANILPIVSERNWPKYTPLQAATDADDRAYRNGKPQFDKGQLNGFKSSNALLNGGNNFHSNGTKSKLLFV